MPVDSMETNAEPTFSNFGILSSVSSIFWNCNYRHLYRYLKISDIGSLFSIPTQD